MAVLTPIPAAPVAAPAQAAAPSASGPSCSIQRSGSLWQLGIEAQELTIAIGQLAQQLEADDDDTRAQALAELEAALLAEEGNKQALSAKADATCWVIEHLRGQGAYRQQQAKRAFVKVLQEQRERILKTRTKHDSEFEQLAFGFADHELRQLRDNRSYWDKRLARIERDLELEPAAIRRTFEVATAPRIEPAGVIVLWPLEAAR